MLQAIAFRNEANVEYEFERFNQAIAKYLIALRILKDEADDDPYVNEVRMTLHSNMSLCYLKLGDYEWALEMADKALEYSPHYPKALYRRASALMHLDRLTECATTLNELLTIDRKNYAAHALLRELSERAEKRSSEGCSAVPRDALRVVKEFSEGTFEDESATYISMQILNTWLVKTGDPTELYYRSAIEYATGILLRYWQADETADNRDVFDSLQPLRLQQQAARFCLLIVLETTYEPDEEDRAVRDKIQAMCLDNPLEVHRDVKRRRETLKSNLPLKTVEKVVRELGRRGLTEIRAENPTEEEQVKILRREIAISLVDLLHYIGDLQKSEVLLALAEGIDMVSCRPVQVRSVISFTFLCDQQRRLGLKSNPLKMSHGLMRCLESLVSLLELDVQFALDAFDLNAIKEGPQQLDGEENACRQVDFALSAVFALLADKERNEEDKVNWNNILDALVGARLREDSSETDRFMAFATLNLLWLADRQEVQRYTLAQALPIVALDHAVNTTFADPRLSKAASEYLVNVMEFPECRALVLEANGLELLHNLFENASHKHQLEYRCTMATVLARLALHREDIKDLIFDKVNFLDLAADIIEAIDLPLLCENLQTAKTNRRLSGQTGRRVARAVTNLLQILFFLSLHGDFKRALLGLPILPDLAWEPEVPPEDETLQEKKAREQRDKVTRDKAVEAADALLEGTTVKPTPLFQALGPLGKAFTILSGSGEAGFLFAGICMNLTRSHQDRDRLKKSRGSPDFDEGQMLELQHIFDNLPAEAKPQDSANFHRGGQVLTRKMREEIIATEQIIPTLKHLCCQSAEEFSRPTSNFLKVCAMTVRNVTATHAHLRAPCFKQGGFAIVRRAIEGFQHLPDETRDFRQTIAHFCISIPPQMFRYPELMGAVSDLKVLLSDSYELFVYEAALGLTNILAINDEVRTIVICPDLKGWDMVREVAESDNPLLRAAGLEMLCNICCSDSVRELLVDSLAKSAKMVYDQELLIAFAGESENTRAWKAACGCLAMMTENVGLALSLARNEKFLNLVNCTELAVKYGDIDIQVRLAVTFSNVWNAIKYILENEVAARELIKLPVERFLTSQKVITNVSEKLFLLFAVLGGELTDEAREILKAQCKMYPKCPVRHLLDQPDKLLPAVAEFYLQN